MKNEITFKSIWKWLRSDKGKKYSFFIFYIFFFIFIFIILSFKDDVVLSDKEETKEQVQQEENSLPFNLTNLENKDYTFTYQVLKNNNLKSYLGSKNNNEIIIKDNDEIYTYLFKNGSLEQNEKLEEFYQLFDIYEIKRIIKNSKYDYKQEYNDGRVIYSYLIESGNLANLLELEIIKDNDYKNQILVKTNEKNEMIEITFDFLSLINSINSLDEEITSYEIIITYGEV